ncbi:glycine cleavage system protein GcvH [Desulforhopalus vacuolatus]|uniref:glycine cleavage system protein GcvH n=1 Tax=Desulforhopalus vacuolatus TaxID=40414 RepID=UPI0019645CB1|nr:glycine cleavage system protein GcvH [Desulforhopalus vacuolatus]
MKELNELNFPDDVKYTREHEWAKIEEGNVFVGITDYAQDQLGDIVFVEMPAEGDSFEEGEEFGTLESVKAVSEIYLPVSGEILAINEALEDEPEMVNKDPYEAWIVKVKPADVSEFDNLMDKTAYLKLVESEFDSEPDSEPDSEFE